MSKEVVMDKYVTIAVTTATYYRQLQSETDIEPETYQGRPK
jgi:hypothetical protein